jgi:hypothetical protein
VSAFDIVASNISYSSKAGYSTYSSDSSSSFTSPFLASSSSSVFCSSVSTLSSILTGEASLGTSSERV